MDERHDPDLEKALCRCEVISAYLALEPGRGQRGLLLLHLAAKRWTGLDGQPMQVSAETVRVWVRRYRALGLDGLRDVPRAPRGPKALTAEQIDLICRLKREVPERSLDRIICIAEDMKLVPAGVLRRSTVHRALKAEGISRRSCRAPDKDDLDRFEAVHFRVVLPVVSVSTHARAGRATRDGARVDPLDPVSTHARAGRATCSIS